MNSFASKVSLSALFALTASAQYTTTLADCWVFAKMFNSACGVDENSTVAYNENLDWMTSESSVDSTCSLNTSASSDLKLKCPETATEVAASASCTIPRKNCVTCEEVSSTVFIRFQSNSMPARCYATNDSSGFPKQH